MLCDWQCWESPADVAELRRGRDARHFELRERSIEREWTEAATRPALHACFGSEGAAALDGFRPP